MKQIPYSSLIFMAIEDSPQKALPVKEIYAWIIQHFPYFKTAPTGWKNSVRHNLSLNKCFQKVEKAAVSLMIIFSTTWKGHCLRFTVSNCLLKISLLSFRISAKVHYGWSSRSIAPTWYRHSLVHLSIPAQRGKSMQKISLKLQMKVQR